MNDELLETRLGLERLRLAVRLGCTAAERALPQAVDVSVGFRLPRPPLGCQSDRLSDTLPLDPVAERLRGVAESGEFALIEHLAARLYEALGALCPPGATLELELIKVAPPIAGLAGGTRFRIAAAPPERGLQAAVTAASDTERARSLLEQNDPAVYAALRGEERRQADSVELIASENYTYPEVLAALGSALTDKYAEGYPGRRYYAGNAFSDRVEELARERACRLFRAEHANVQPLSGSPMNQAVYLGLLEPGDTILALELSHGGHLTHGSPHSHLSRIFRFVHYRTRPGDGRIDPDEVLRAAREARPKLVLCGYTSYPRDFDYGAFRRIADDVGALAMADVSHVGGLIAGGALANPLDHGFDVMTTTTHKTLRGPRAGLILCRRVHARALDRSVFPGLQGGPHMNTIAAVAVALGKALEPGFAGYARAVLDNAQALARALSGEGLRLVSGGTENHLLVLDTRASLGLDGARAERALEQAGITCNKQLVPDDPSPPLTPSGVRLGTPAVTTRGMGPAEMALLGGWIAEALRQPDDATTLATLRERCRQLCQRFPIPRAGSGRPSAVAQP
jgi:glycine hydroxymethyltransferase